MGFVRSEINIWINRTTTKDASSTLRIINQSIRRRLKIDRKNRVHQVGEDVELLMTQGNIKESWGGVYVGGTLNPQVDIPKVPNQTFNE